MQAQSVSFHLLPLLLLPTPIIWQVHAFERTLIEDLITLPVLKPYRKIKSEELRSELAKSLCVPPSRA